MADLVEKLTAQGDGQPASKSMMSSRFCIQVLSPRPSLTDQPFIGFLNDIVTLLWPNIRVAGAQLIKDVVEPMFKTMLPGPLATLHFTKIDFGATPMTISNVQVTKTSNAGIKLDLNVDWNGQCDFQLDGKMVPKVVGFATSAPGEGAWQETVN